MARSAGSSTDAGAAKGNFNVETLPAGLKVLVDGKPVGSIQEVTLARVLHDNSDPAQVRIRDVMARPLPTLDVSVDLDEAYRLLLSGNTGVLATKDGRVVDIVTRIDLVEYWNKQRKK